LKIKKSGKLHPFSNTWNLKNVIRRGIVKDNFSEPVDFREREIESQKFF